MATNFKTSDDTDLESLFRKPSTSVTAGTYGPTADVTITGGTAGSFNVPQFTVDAYGIITSISNRTMTFTNTNADCKATNTCNQCATTNCNTCNQCVTTNCNTCNQCVTTNCNTCSQCYTRNCNVCGDGGGSYNGEGTDCNYEVTQCPSSARRAGTQCQGCKQCYTGNGNCDCRSNCNCNCDCDCGDD